MDPLDPPGAGGGASLAADRLPLRPAEPQLSLFGADPRAGELRSLLVGLDLERLSARDALTLLYEWRERLVPVDPSPEA